MVRFTLRELRSLSNDKSLSSKERSSIKRYLSSKEAKERMARGRRMMASRRNNNPYSSLTRGFRFKF